MTLQTADRKRRPRRIAADEAHAWARNLRLGNPYAKLVLSMLTIYVNGEGSCFVSIAQLAEDCELAENTVRRRLTYLEQIGAIAKFPQWRDEHGRMNGEGRGRRTTDDIRLLISADPDDIEARAIGGNSEPETDDEIGDSVAVRGAGGEPLDSAPDSVSPSLGVQQPPHCGQGLITEPEPEKIPPNPPSGGEWHGHETWEGFEKAYPEPILRQSMARQVWSALTDTERELATKAAEGYTIHRKQQRKPPNVLNAHTFLREPAAWPRYAALVQRVAEIKQVTTVDRNSREGLALEAIYALARVPVPRSSGDGDRYVLRAPLTPQQLKLADAPVSTKDWKFVDLPNSTGAWLELMKPIVGRGPLVEDHIVGQKFIKGPDGKDVFSGYDKRRGFYAPWRWPPRVDGTLSTSTDPPSLATEQDLQELSNSMGK